MKTGQDRIIANGKSENLCCTVGHILPVRYKYMCSIQFRKQWKAPHITIPNIVNICVRIAKRISFRMRKQAVYNSELYGLKGYDPMDLVDSDGPC